MAVAPARHVAAGGSTGMVFCPAVRPGTISTSNIGKGLLGLGELAHIVMGEAMSP
jgi:hypothetical protein